MGFNKLGATVFAFGAALMLVVWYFAFYASSGIVAASVMAALSAMLFGGLLLVGLFAVAIGLLMLVI